MPKNFMLQEYWEKKCEKGCTTKYRACRRLSFPAEADGVVSLPEGVSRAALGVDKQVALAQAARVLAGRGEATHLAMFVHRLAQPLDLGVLADGLVEGVDQDDLEELVGGVLGHPVRVEHTQTSASSAYTLLEHTQTSQGLVYTVFRHENGKWKNSLNW
jgi:hypothetical protein